MKPGAISTHVWLTLGAICAALTSLPLMLSGNPGALSPTPIYVMILVFIFGPAIFVILPALFALQFLALHKRQSFLKIQLVFLTIVWVLTPLYFWSSWDYGLRWMGKTHTYTVFALHLSGLVLISLLALAAFLKSSSSLSKTLNILSFFFLFWCAFPILGEMP